jgi:hypothetical protein
MRSFLPLVEFRIAVALLHLARVDPGEGQRAHERVVHDLERQAGERHVVVRAARDVAGFGLVAGAKPM